MTYFFVTLMATIQSKTVRGHKYWYIVESRRVNGKSRPIVLAYLGKADTLLKRLQGLIEDLKLKSKRLCRSFNKICATPKGKKRDKDQLHQRIEMLLNERYIKDIVQWVITGGARWQARVMLFDQPR
ncbi:MAG: hypothetical protein GF350_08870 [Chitinivibrionales bacterium]|nr:hypothetical protein [Chitinivibrionales bacterium]